MSAPVALVFGGSGQIGHALLARLAAQGWHCLAISRERREDRDGVRWLRGCLDPAAASQGLPGRCDAIFSCGPLDLFSIWYAGSGLDCGRILAFGSTSRDVKRHAQDPDERALADVLRRAEERVFDAAAARGVHATLLRPTLVYGAGRDANLTRIARLATRAGFFPLPRGATGLRQPVHVEDLAAAAADAADSPATHGKAYALPGGETLPYREMVARTLAALPSKPSLLELPGPIFRVALSAARATGRLQGLPPGAIARMREDLVFDATPAQRDFGYAPRGFHPTAQTFFPPESDGGHV
ncbi:NAD-dependent epimerase/dehydratase family protein [Luteimonas sp. JM171]|uniref:NAD-dependent epimerase/dehydratase family protein n=1 Tax=Luteimonas sp. JM171 TaxID=1896164 RepID=UPI0008554505|nr:NAD-dependent epimerase/dehydratase family protein [Luteimonas sp. JM171]AOH36103.1 nucleoside-diphosphate sugar epimerase [Luteimonas sp. JM171]